MHGATMKFSLFMFGEKPKLKLKFHTQAKAIHLHQWCCEAIQAENNLVEFLEWGATDCETAMLNN